MDNMTLTKIQISGPTLASLLHRVSSSSGDIDGLLFGHVTTTTPITLSDDPSPSSTTTISDQPTLTATVTSFFSSTTTATFYTPSGDINTQTLTTLTSNQPPLIGWFSSRRKTHLRPSMRETQVTSSLVSNLGQNPCFVFMLLTTPFHDQLIHTHEYKAFQYVSISDIFVPKSLDVVNLGPAFRGHYGNFTPSSLFPDLPFEVKGLNNMIEDDVNDDNGKTDNEKFGKMCDENDGFNIGRLKNLMGENAAKYTDELEMLYNGMIKKLNGLAKVVEGSSAKVLEQENHNMKLRYKVAGFE
uniref:uncharacterized protein LOC122592828 n=1 Tax=Erigeron canadensis TaxID=72917 RepID=UPI001CB8B3E8|nr:uncharacterized protein LOC122592828 [Erigeron canadensis]